MNYILNKFNFVNQLYRIAICVTGMAGFTDYDNYNILKFCSLLLKDQEAIIILVLN